MGICRDCFGRLSYTAVNSRNGVFSVTKEKRGPYEIIKHEPYYRTNANIFLEKEMAFWEECPKFSSFVKAVKYMKDNLEDLL